MTSRNLAILFPDWNSLDSVRNAHSILELCAIWLFAALVVCDVVAHLLEDSRKSLAKIIERIGLCCFAIAVASELIAYKYGQRNDELSAGVITSLSTVAGDALKKAEAAHELAQSASDTAKPAKETADKAKSEADAVGEKANTLTGQMSTAEKELADAQAEEEKERRNLVNLAVCTAPRIIPSWEIFGVESSSDPLKPFAGRHVVIEFVPDTEVRRTTTSLVKTLKDAGWEVDRLTPIEGINDGVAIQPYFVLPVKGGQVADWWSHLRGSDAANTLVDFLHSYDWQAKWEWPAPGTNDIPRDGVKIRIGLYPAVTLVSPPGAKDFLAATAQNNRAKQESARVHDRQQEEREQEILKELSPQQVSEFKARRDWSRAQSELIERRLSDPCQPLSGTIPLLNR